MIQVVSSRARVYAWDGQQLKLITDVNFGGSDPESRVVQLATIRTAEISPDGTLLALAVENRSQSEIQFFSALPSARDHGDSTDTKQTVPLSRVRAGTVLSMAFGSDSTSLVTASIGSPIRVWGARSGRLLRIIGNVTDGPRTVASSLDGTAIVAGCVDTKLRI